MKLLLVGYLHTEGGVRHLTMWLARGMAERGHDVTVATPSPIGDQPMNMPDEPNIRIVNIAGLNQILFGYPGGRDHAFDCAIVIGTGWKSMIGPLLNRRIRKRVFFEVMSAERNGLLDPRMLVHLGFDAIVGIVKRIEDKFCESFAWRGRHTTIPAMPHPLERWADLTRIPPPPPKRGAIRAAYFSRLVPHKGAYWLVDHWEQVSENVGTLDIWGTGSDEERIRDLIEAKGLGDRIKMRGAYSGDAAYVAQTHQYDVELLPTHGVEGAPLVLLEAMACGLPFVANGVAGIRDYTNPDCRITSGDMAEYLPALASMAEALYAGEIDHARLQRLYSDTYSFAALCDRWETFLGEIIAA